MPKAKVEQVDMFDGVAPAPGKVVEQAQGIWNEHAKLYKWKLCKVLDKTRQAQIKRAVGDYGGITGWRDALASVAKNRFVQGMIAPREGYKQFVANIDWFCRPVTVRKVLEDFYEDEGADNKQRGVAGSGPTETELEKWGRWLKTYKPGRFWPSSQGPRPEDSRCTAPAGPLQYWREQNGVTITAPIAQPTAIERRRDTIIVLRKSGEYGRANDHEEILAKMENRPPVLVPDPRVASVGMPEKAPCGAPETRPLPHNLTTSVPDWTAEEVPDSAYHEVEA